jgi:hypothetical protein
MHRILVGAPHGVVQHHLATLVRDLGQGTKGGEEGEDEDKDMATRRAMALFSPAWAVRWSGVSRAAWHATSKCRVRWSRSNARSACLPTTATWRSVFPPAVVATSMSRATRSARRALTSRRALHGVGRGSWSAMPWRPAAAGSGRRRWWLMLTAVGGGDGHDNRSLELATAATS